MTINPSRVFHAGVLVLVTGLVIAATYRPVSAQRRPAAATASAVTAQIAPQTADKGYVGEETCRSCHRAELTEFHKTEHAHVAGAASAGGQQMNCETCHGPGKAHADGEQASHGDDALSAAASKLIFSFKGTPQQNAARCLTCHASAPAQKDFAHSQHAASGVSCQACHSTHLVEAADSKAARPAPPAQAQFFAVPQLAAEQRWLRESLTKDSQPGLCYTCHAAERAQFSQPFHHRVPEGAMKCTDCHNAHGTENRASLTSPNWDTCTTCHADKHGPFVFEHAAVRVEGCAVCHTPHGSTSRFMLARRESRFLCLQCHGDQHSAVGQAAVPHSRLGFQESGDCTRCHTAIHGSNLNPNFLQ